jgi:hypothetical protein
MSRDFCAPGHGCSCSARCLPPAERDGRGNPVESGAVWQRGLRHFDVNVGGIVDRALRAVGPSFGLCFDDEGAH